MERNNDQRSRKIIFVSSCLLNVNNKVMGLSRYSSACKEVVDTLINNDFGIMQMPCPETLYSGVNRWWQTKNLYKNVGFIRHCRSLASQMVDYIENYGHVGYKVSAIISCNGSPTCGVTLTSWGNNWGGEPSIPLNYEDTLIEGMGIYTEELVKEIECRHFPVPKMYGINLDDQSKTMDEILKDFRDFIRDL